MKFKARVNEKRKLEVNWNKVDLYLSRMKPGTALDFEIVKRQRTVSDPMRCYYFGAVLPPILEHCGYERDESEQFHQLMKIKYFNIEPDERGMYRNVPSVFGNESKLPVSEKEKYLDWIIRHAARMGIYIPDPGEKVAATA